MANWVIRAHPDFLAMLYTLPRGEAAKVTEGVRQLANNPTPPGSTPVPERSGRHMLVIDVYMVIYELNTEQASIRLLVLSRTPN
jgi:mRNA-degrading endonuclease RelE of RelBE toxin-antitoxin system